MWRYFVASLVIGAFITLAVLAFDAAGLFPWLAAHLQRFYLDAEFGGTLRPLRILSFGVVIAAAFGVAWVAIESGRPRSRWFIVAGTALVILAASPVLALYGVLFEPFSGCVAALAAGVAGAAYARGEVGRRKRVFRERVAGRVSQASMVALARAPFEVKFKGEGRGVSVLVCKILNQDELRANLRAREAIDLCNYFLGAGAAFLVERGAYLDEVSADELRFYFGLPLADAEHAAAACRVALALRERLGEVAGECEQRWSQRPEWGVGIDSGEMTVGLYGGGQFARFSALGEPPNRAARLGVANRIYGSAVLVSAGTMAAVDDAMELRAIDRVADIEGEVEIYELLAEAGELAAPAAERRDAFWRGLIRFREGDTEAALNEFDKARPTGSHDRPLEYYIARLRAEISD